MVASFRLRFPCLVVVPSILVCAIAGRAGDGRHWIRGGATDFGTIHDAIDGDLEDWLAKIQITVPPDALPASSSGALHYHLKNLRCTNVQIGTTVGVQPRLRESGGLSSSLNADGSLSVELEKIGWQCKGTLDYSYNVLSGYANIDLSTKSAALKSKLHLSSSDASGPQVPDKVVLDVCQFDANVLLAIPGGTFWTHVMKLFPEAITKIQDKLNDIIQDLVCKTLSKKFADAVTVELGHLHSFSHSQINIPIPDMPPWNDSLVAWDTVPLVHWIEHIQEALPDTRGTIRDILSRVFPSNSACLLSGDASEICATSRSVCIFGGDKDCLANKSLHSDPPLVLQMDLSRVSAKFADPGGTILKGRQAHLHSRLNDSSVILSIGADLSFSGSAGGADIINLAGLATFELVLNRVDLSAAVFAAVDRAEFTRVRTTDYIFPRCMQTAIRAIKIANASATFSVDESMLTFSQKNKYKSPLLAEVANLTNHALGTLWKYDEAMAAVLRGYLLGGANRRIDSWLQGLDSKSCPTPKGEETGGGIHRPLIDPELGSKLNWMACTFASLAISWALVQMWREKRCSHASPILLRRHETLVRRHSMTPWFGDALGMSQAVPGGAGGFIFLAIIGCVFLLGASNVLYMAELGVNLELGQEGTTIYQIMPFSIFYSIHELFDKAHLPVLAYTLLIFSGMLPYTKLGMMFLMWVLPARVINRKWRGRILLFLDEIGKFSLVDVFVIQFINGSLFSMMQLAPLDSSLHFAIAARTTEKIGFFVFVMATVGSLIIGHSCLFFHQQDPFVRLDYQRELLKQVDSPDKHVRLRAAQTVREVDEIIFGKKRRWVGPSLMVLLALVVLSCTVPAITVQMRIAGMEVRTARYSVVGFATSMHSFSLKIGFGTLFSQITFIVFVLCTIIMHISVLLVIWYVGIAPHWWTHMSTVAHTLFAWSALDVMALSMAVTLIEMKESNFAPLHGGQMNLLSKLLGQPVTDSRGVSLDVVLESGTYLAVLASVIHACLGRLVMVMLERAVAVRRGESVDIPSSVSLVDVCEELSPGPARTQQNVDACNL